TSFSRDWSSDVCSSDLALAAEELVRERQADRLARLRVDRAHVAPEAARADAQKRQPVAVVRVHVGLDLEYRRGERLGRGVDEPEIGRASCREGGETGGA